MRILILFLLLSQTILAQEFTLSGTVKDEKKKGNLPGASIVLTNLRDSTKTGGYSDSKGKFEIEKINRGRYFVKISFIGYKSFEDTLRFRDKDINLGTVSLDLDSIMLNEVVVTGKAPIAEMKGDTTQFNATSFKTNKDATAEDLVQKMPGVTVESGTVKAQGENVKEVLVDNKPFFGTDPSAALKNMPAEVIDKVQVFDKQSEQARFTGFDDGDRSKTMNIITKLGMRNGVFGKAYAGYGTENRYQAGALLNIFDNAQRFTILVNSNNINQQNFSADDFLGMMGSFGNRGGAFQGFARQALRSGMANDMMVRFAGNTELGSFLVGSQSGVATLNSIGMNYSDEWGSKINVSGSYFFSLIDNTSIKDKQRSYLLASMVNQKYYEDNTYHQKNNNHRFNFRFEYNPDSTNRFLIRPAFSYQGNNNSSIVDGETYNLQNLVNNIKNDYTSKMTGVNFSNELFYSHKFQDTGRTASVSFNTSYNPSQGNTYLDAATVYALLTADSDTLDQIADINKKGLNLSSNVSLTEGTFHNQMVQLSWYSSMNQNDSRKETYDQLPAGEIRDTSLSSVFKSIYRTNRLDLSYRIQTDKARLNFGVAYKRSDLNNDQTYPYDYLLNKNFSSWLPSLWFMYQISKQQNFRMSYRTSTNNPSVDQLQEVLDNSDPNQLSIGNSNLKEDYRHNFNVSYSSVSTDFSGTWFIMLNGGITENYVGKNTFRNYDTTTVFKTWAAAVPLTQGVSLTRPENMDGYGSLNSFTTYGQYISFLRSNLNFNGSFNYSRTPSIVNDISNFAYSKAAGLGLVLSSNISENIDFTVSSMSTMNYITNSINTQQNNNYFVQNSRLKLDWTIWQGIVFSTLYTHQYNKGLSSSYKPTNMLLNVSLAKKFLPNDAAEIRLSVYDALNSNSALSRNVTESYIEDQTTNVQQRYYMLTFTYNLRFFGGWNQGGKNKRDPKGMFPMGGPPGGPGGGPPPGF